MKFTVNKNEFLNLVTICQKANNDVFNSPILEGVLIEAKNNTLTLSATNLNEAITGSIPATITEEDSLVISSKILLEVKKFPTNELSFETAKDDTVIIKSGKVKASFKVLGTKSNFPELPSIKDELFRFDIKSSVLIESIKEVLFAVAKDDTRPILQGIYFNNVNKKLDIVSLDGYRLSKKTIDMDKENFSFICSSKILSDLSKIFSKDELITVSVSQNRIQFSIKDLIISSKLLEGTFVNYNSLIPVDFKTEIEFEASLLKETIDRCNIVSKEKHIIKFNINSNKLTVSSKDAFGEVEEELDFKVNGEDLLVAFNSVYIKDAIQNEKTLILKLNSATSPALLVRKDSPDIARLVLPVRLIK